MSKCNCLCTLACQSSWECRRGAPRSAYRSQPHARHCRRARSRPSMDVGPAAGEHTNHTTCHKPGQNNGGKTCNEGGDGMATRDRGVCQAGPVGRTVERYALLARGCAGRCQGEALTVTGAGDCRRGSGRRGAAQRTRLGSNSSAGLSCRPATGTRRRSTPRPAPPARRHRRCTRHDRTIPAPTGQVARRPTPPPRQRSAQGSPAALTQQCRVITGRRRPGSGPGATDPAAAGADPAAVTWLRSASDGPDRRPIPPATPESMTP